jgi:long-subunit acyl-CoA synthetase (AMP-forming)/CheY-like chemotaxis protein
MTAVPTDEMPRVLVVDDEPDMAELYAEYLEAVANVSMATDGREALEQITDDVDVVFLDREMPGLSGDQVLERIRADGYDCYVAMVTGVEPDLTVFDMEFDEYVRKPATEEQLQETLAELLQRSAFGEELRDLFAKTSKRNVVSDGDPDDAWTKREISVIVQDAEVAPAPGVFGGWNSGRMAIREEEEREFTADVSRNAIPFLLERTAERRGDRPAQFFRLEARPRSVADLFETPDGDRRTVSYDLYREIVRGLAVGFANLGVEPGSPVLLASGSRVEAAWTDLGILAAGGVVAGIDPDTPEDAVRKWIDRLDPVGIVVETAAAAQQWDRVLASSTVEFVAVLDELSQPAAYRSPVVEVGTLYRQARDTADDIYGGLLARLEPDAPAALVTGGDVGALALTHRNLLENAAQVYARLSANRDGPVSPSEGDEVLTALSPTRPYGRVINHYLGLLFDGPIVYPESTDRILETARLDRPTMLAAPTDLAEQYVGRAVAEAYAESTVATEWSLDVGARLASNHRYADEPGGWDRLATMLADRIGVAEIRAQAGAPDAVLHGPDPLEETTHQHLLGAGIVPVCCWSPARAGVVVSASPPEAPRAGTLGVPLYDETVEVHWTPAVETESETDDVGELAVGGPNVPSTAWDDGSTPFDEDGNLKTGVVVEWDGDDYLRRRS